MFKLLLEKAGEPEIKFPTSVGSSKKQEFQKIIYFWFIDNTKPLTVWIITNCGKFWKRWEYHTTWPGSCDRRAKAQPRGATPCLRSGAEVGRTPCPKGGGQEELPHVRGQGQWPRVPDCDGAGTAERSYPASEVRSGSREEIPSVRGQGQRREELPRVRGQGRRPGGATPRPRPGAVAGRTNPTSKEGQEGRRWGDTPRPR